MPASTTRSRGCARCSTGRTRSPDAANGSPRFKQQPVHRHDLRADAAGQGRRPAARRDADRLRLRRAHEPRPSLPRRARRRRRWCRSTTRCATASASRSSRRSRAVRRATGSMPSSATCRATARARRCGSGSRRSSSTRRSRRGARWSSASSRALGQTALKLEAVAAKAGFAKTDDLFAAFARDEINSKQVQAAINAVAQPATARTGARRARSRHAAQPRDGLGQRHPRRRRRPAADRARALLQAGAARSDRRLRHARQGHHDSSRGVRERRRASARASRSG